VIGSIGPQKRQTTKELKLIWYLIEMMAALLCVIKYTDKPFLMTKHYAGELRQKEEIFIRKTKSKKQVFWSLITPDGAVSNTILDQIISHTVTVDDLFC
jgi:hypothetical protein